MQGQQGYSPGQAFGAPVYMGGGTGGGPYTNLGPQAYPQQGGGGGGGFDGAAYPAPVYMQPVGYNPQLQPVYVSSGGPAGQQPVYAQQAYYVQQVPPQDQQKKKDEDNCCLFVVLGAICAACCLCGGE
jgi:hypothetical protein